MTVDAVFTSFPSLTTERLCLRQIQPTDAEDLFSCGFHHFDAGFHRAETGYKLQRAFWEQGRMAEAVSAILSYRFDFLGLHLSNRGVRMQKTEGPWDAAWRISFP